MQEFEPEALTELIGRIYESAVDSSQWSDFLALVERFHPDCRITLFGHEGGRPSEALTVHKNYQPDDLRAYLPEVLRLPDPEATARLEALIRCYDPCISCATHFLELDVQRLPGSGG